jgi:hypothetical protein
MLRLLEPDEARKPAPSKYRVSQANIPG